MVKTYDLPPFPPFQCCLSMGSNFSGMKALIILLVDVAALKRERDCEFLQFSSNSCSFIINFFPRPFQTGAQLIGEIYIAVNKTFCRFIFVGLYSMSLIVGYKYTS